MRNHAALCDNTGRPGSYCSGEHTYYCPVSGTLISVIGRPSAFWPACSLECAQDLNPDFVEVRDEETPDISGDLGNNTSSDGSPVT